MAAKLHAFVSLLAIIECSSQIGGHRNFRVLFTNMSTKSFANELKLNASVDRTVGSVSVYMNVLTKISTAYLTALGYTDSGNGRYDLELFNRTIDVCMLFENNRYEPLLQIGLKLFKKETGVTLPKRCPITKRLYTIKDVVIYPQFLPAAMPEKSVAFKFTVFSKDDSILKDLGMLSGNIGIQKNRRTKL